MSIFKLLIIRKHWYLQIMALVIKYCKHSFSHILRHILYDIDAHRIGMNSSIEYLRRKISFLYCVLNSAGMEKILRTGTLK